MGVRIRLKVRPEAFTTGSPMAVMGTFLQYQGEFLWIWLPGIVFALLSRLFRSRMKNEEGQVADDDQIHLKEEGYRGKVVTVKIRVSEFKTYTRAKSFDRFTDCEPEIRRAAFECPGRLEIEKRIRLIGLRISHLEKEEETS